MATFPFTFEENFEGGTLGDFDATVDTNGKLTFPHYTVLAGIPGLPAPWSGAYCMRIDVSVGTAAAHIQETGDFDITADSETLFVRWMQWIPTDLVMANTDEFALFQFWSSTNTVEAGVYINFTTASGLRVGIGEASASSFLPMPQGRWVSLEVSFVPGTSSDSTLDLWVDNGAAAQVGSFTSATITSGVMGTIGLDAGTTSGNLLYDNVKADATQIYAPIDRFTNTPLLTDDGHAFVGPGTIENITLLSGNGTNNIVTIFDTDTATINDLYNIRAQL